MRFIFIIVGLELGVVVECEGEEELELELSRPLLPAGNRSRPLNRKELSKTDTGSLADCVTTFV